MNLSRILIEFLFGSILVLIGLISFYKNLIQKKDSTFIDISLIITTLSFGISPLFMLINGFKFKFADNNDVTLSYIGILLFILGLHFVKKLLFKSFYSKTNLSKIIKNYYKISSKEILLFYSIFFSIRLILAFVYGITLSGTATLERVLSIPYYLFILKSLSDISFWGCILWCYIKILSERKFKGLPAVIVSIEVLLSFFVGRRYMFFLVFLFFFVFVLLGYKIKFRTIIYFISIILFLTIFIFPAFFTFRSDFLNRDLDFFEGVKYSFSMIVLLGTDEKSYQLNLADRTYINDWNISIISKSSLLEGLGGQALINSFIYAIPRFIFQDKLSLKDPEYLINYKLAIGSFDAPSNWIAYGFADFGLIGGFIYGIILGTILFFLQSFANYNLEKFPFITFITTGSSLYFVYMVEETPIFGFSLIRDTLILYLIYSIFFSFMYKKINNSK